MTPAFIHQLMPFILLPLLIAGILVLFDGLIPPSWIMLRGIRQAWWNRAHRRARATRNGRVKGRGVKGRGEFFWIKFWLGLAIGFQVVALVCRLLIRWSHTS